MSGVQELLERNRAWAARMRGTDPGFFQRLAAQQTPRYLWIGCSDSRVPSSQITGLAPGDLFVHRNVANIVVHTDLNCLSVVQFAIDLLRVQDVIVAGHYGCAGIQAALAGRKVGIADNWLRHVKNVYARAAAELDAIADPRARERRLCELNVLEQVRNLCDTTVVQDAWARNQRVAVHGWIYDLEDGLLRDLQCTRTAETP